MIAASPVRRPSSACNCRFCSAVIIRTSWLRRVINALSFRVSGSGRRRNSGFITSAKCDGQGSAPNRCKPSIRELLQLPLCSVRSSGSGGLAVPTVRVERLYSRW